MKGGGDWAATGGTLSRLDQMGKAWATERERWKMGAKLMESCQRRESGFALAKRPLGGPGDVKVQVQREVF